MAEGSGKVTWIIIGSVIGTIIGIVISPLVKHVTSHLYKQVGINVSGPRTRIIRRK